MEHRFVAPETLYRMLDKAHAEGVAVLGVTHHPTKPGILGAHVSSSRAGELPYAVWLYGADSGCDCPGYAKHGYCKHWALVLDRAGLLPELEEEPGSSPAQLEPAGITAEAQADPWVDHAREHAAALARTEAFIAAMQRPDRKAAALVDLTHRQAASAEASPVRGKRVRKAAA